MVSHSLSGSLGLSLVTSKLHIFSGSCQFLDLKSGSFVLFKLFSELTSVVGEEFDFEFVNGILQRSSSARVKAVD